MLAEALNKLNQRLLSRVLVFFTTVFLTYFLVLKFGIVGAAMAFLIGQILFLWRSYLREGGQGGMKQPSYHRLRQRSSVFVALLLFQLVLVLLQLWLFVAVLEGILDGELGMAVPAALVSAVCLAVNTWMLRGVGKTDHES